MANPNPIPPVEAFYQTVGFHFRVTFSPLPGKDEVDVRFQSVSGLDVQIETEPLKEGGENRFTHVLPGRRKYADALVLKRGLLLPGQSWVTDWCINAFQHLIIQPLDTVNVQLLNEDHEPLVWWQLSHVWPKSWKVADLNAERGEVLIETLELHYNRFEYKK